MSQESDFSIELTNRQLDILQTSGDILISATEASRVLTEPEFLLKRGKVEHAHLAIRPDVAISCLNSFFYLDYVEHLGRAYLSLLENDEFDEKPVFLEEFIGREIQYIEYLLSSNHSALRGSEELAKFLSDHLYETELSLSDRPYLPLLNIAKTEHLSGLDLAYVLNQSDRKNIPYPKIRIALFNLRVIEAHSKGLDPDTLF